MRTDLSYWARGIRYLASLLPFGKPTRLAIADMWTFRNNLMSIIRLGMSGRTCKAHLVDRAPLSSIHREQFVAAFADALWRRSQEDISKNMIEDYLEAYRAAELQKGS